MPKGVYDRGKARKARAKFDPREEAWKRMQGMGEGQLANLTEVQTSLQAEGIKLPSTTVGRLRAKLQRQRNGSSNGHATAISGRAAVLENIDTVLRILSKIHGGVRGLEEAVWEIKRLEKVFNKENV